MRLQSIFQRLAILLVGVLTTFNLIALFAPQLTLHWLGYETDGLTQSFEELRIYAEKSASFGISGMTELVERLEASNQNSALMPSTYLNATLILHRSWGANQCSSFSHTQTPRIGTARQ